MNAENKLLIQELLSRAAYSFDERDLDMLGQCFAPDATMLVHITGTGDVGPFDVGLVGPHPPSGECAVEVRAFFGDGTGGVREDPVTGSLNASLAQWLTEEGVLDPSRMLSVGIKGPLNSRKDFEYGNEHGIELITYEQWVREGKVKYKEFVTEGLDSAPEAFMGLLKGANFGKQLVRVGPDKA